MSEKPKLTLNGDLLAQRMSLDSEDLAVAHTPNRSPRRPIEQPVDDSISSRPEHSRLTKLLRVSFATGALVAGTWGATVAARALGNQEHNWSQNHPTHIQPK